MVRNKSDVDGMGTSHFSFTQYTNDIINEYLEKTEIEGNQKQN